MPKPYRLLLFDCVNTVFLPDPSDLPRVELGGVPVPSTAPLLHARLAPLRPGLAPEEVHHAARAAWKWAEAQRGPEVREVPAGRRFRRFFAELGLEGADEALVQELLEVHMRAVTGSFVLPPAHQRVLAELRGRFRLALFSNFDHAPSLRRRLQETGIAGWFEPLIISDGLGYRKPGRTAFERALALLGEAPGHVLFVGDSVEDDLRGGTAAGLDVAWLNPRGEPPPPDAPPAYTLPALTALPGVLRC